MADLRGYSLVAGFPIWHMGNMGSGSGLDADTVDGYHLNQGVLKTDSPTFANIYTTGKIGIGTSTPISSMDILLGNSEAINTAASTVPNGNLAVGSPGTSSVLTFGVNTSSYAWIQYTHRSDASASFPLVLNPVGGKVGVGLFSPSARLHVKENTMDNLAIFESSYGSGGIRIRAKDTASSAWLAFEQGASSPVISMQNQTNGDFSIYLQPSTQTGWTERFRIVNANGNVGINTTTPGAQLHVVEADSGTGAIFENKGGQAIVAIRSKSSTDSASLYFQLGADDVGSIEVEFTSGDMAFWTNPVGGTATWNERMRILNSNGNVGIGTTSPSNKLDVAGGVGIYRVNVGNTDVTNLLDITADYDYQLLHASSTKSWSTRPTLAMHVPTASDFGVYSTSWTQLLSVEGGTGNTSIKGILKARNGGASAGLSSVVSLELGLNDTAHAGAIKIWGTTSGDYSLIQTTTVNLHLDSNAGGIYLGYYGGNGTFFGNGASGIVAKMDITGQLWNGNGTNKYWHAGNLTGDQTDHYHSEDRTWDNFINIPTTISGYGITDAYTQTDIETFRDETFDNFTFTGGIVTYDASAAFKVGISTGTFYIGGKRFTPASTTLTFAAASTNHVYVDNSGNITSTTGSFALSDNYAYLADVVIGSNISSTAPPQAPSLTTTTTGGNLAPATYYISYTWVTDSGTKETTMGIENSIKVPTGTSTNIINVVIPAFPTGATQANIYMCSSLGETKYKVGSTIATAGATVTITATSATGTAPIFTITDMRNIITSSFGAYTYNLSNSSYVQTFNQRGTGGILRIQDASVDKVIIDASGNIKLENGADFYAYSDGGSTQKFFIDGATGNTSISGTLGVTGATTLSSTLSVTGNTTLSGTLNVTGTITGSLSGNASTSTTLATARTITLSGDVSGSAAFDGSTNITISTSLTKIPTTQPGTLVEGSIWIV